MDEKNKGNSGGHKEQEEGDELTNINLTSVFDEEKKDKENDKGNDKNSQGRNKEINNKERVSRSSSYDQGAGSGGSGSDGAGSYNTGGGDGNDGGNSSDGSPGKRGSRLKNIAVIGACVGAFALGGKYMDTISYYAGGTIDETINTFSSSYNDTKRGMINWLQKGMEPKDDEVFYASKEDIISHAEEIMKDCGKNDKCGIEQEKIDNLYGLSMKAASSKEVASNSAEATMESVREGRIKDEGLVYLRDAIDEQLPERRVFAETLDYAVEDTTEKGKIRILREVYKTTEDEHKSQFSVYAVSLIDDEGKRDKTIMAMLPQLSDEGKKDTAKRMVDAVVGEYRDRIEEKLGKECRDSALCGNRKSMYEKLGGLKNVLEDVIINEMDAFETYMSY
ncbi:MAG: hypothetical protein R6U32_01330 [Candidatus Woesearchaeota archaeon]